MLKKITKQQKRKMYRLHYNLKKKTTRYYLVNEP